MSQDALGAQFDPPPVKFWPTSTMTQEESRKAERERLKKIHAEQDATVKRLAKPKPRPKKKP